MAKPSPVVCWGTGGLENLPAHDLAFQVVTTSPDLAEVASGLSRKVDDLRKLVALGELLSAARGHLDAIEDSPPLCQWVVTNSPEVSPELCQQVADRLEAAAASSPLRQWWSKQGEDSLERWVQSVTTCVTRLRSSRPGRKKKLPELSKPALLKLFKKQWHGEVLNLCYEMYRGKSYRGYPQLYVRMEYVDVPTAVEMSRSQSVVSLSIQVDSAHEDPLMLTQVKLLLRSWGPQIRRLATDVPKKKTRSTLLKNLTWELAHMPDLEVFSPECFLVDDAVIEAVAANPKLREVRVHHGDEATNKSLDILSKCPSLEHVSFWQSKITSRKAAAFERAFPNLGVRFTW